MNVISNLPLLLFGTAGLWMMNKSMPNNAFEELRTSYMIFFIGIFFTGIGSAFYHWNPGNSSLVWDRLPMTVSFMAFFSIITGVMIDKRSGKQILWPLVPFGILSVLYWVTTGDLRLYVLVQFLPIVLTFLILLLYKNDLKKYFWLMILFYALAKIFEALDYEMYFVLGIISGHSIKHLIASIVPLIFIFGFCRKKRITGSL